MCGIAGLYVHEPDSIDSNAVERLVNGLLKGIEPRGKDATGFAAASMGGKHVQLHKDAKPASVFVSGRPDIADDPRMVLLHTRFATQGAPENLANNHPVVVNTCFAIHNGHISNDRELFWEHDLMPSAEVDSEIIPALISFYGFDDGVKSALEELDGNYAVAAMDPVNSPDKLVLAKGWSSPLVVLQRDGFLIWASTWDAIADAYKATWGQPPKDKHFELKLGEILTVTPEGVEMSEFDPLQKYAGSTRYYGTSTCSTNGYTGSAPSTTRSSGPGARQYALATVCLCGHTQLWHATDKHTGKCLSTDCDDCTSFTGSEVLTPDDILLAQSAEKRGFLFCDSCEDWYPPAIMERWGTYEICKNCARGQGVQVVQDDDGDFSEEERMVMAEIAERTHYNVRFVCWLLWEVPFSVLDDSDVLQEMRQEIDDLYRKIEGEWGWPASRSAEEKEEVIQEAEVIQMHPQGGDA